MEIRNAKCSSSKHAELIAVSFCPECKKAKLSHTIETNIKRAYLSSKNIEEHSIDCV